MILKPSALSSLWTFPSILLSAFVIAWGAEAAQFLISQGLALAILAWLQTMPEFAVEAVIAWQAGKDPSKTHLVVEHEYPPARIQDKARLTPILQGSIAFVRHIDEAAASMYALHQALEAQGIPVQGVGRQAYRT